MPDAVTGSNTSTSSQSTAGAGAAPNPSSQELASGDAAGAGQGQAASPKVAPSLETLKAARRAAAAVAQTVSTAGAKGADPAGQAQSPKPDGSGTGAAQTPAQDPTLTQFVSLRREIEQLKAEAKAATDHAPVIDLGKKLQAAQELVKAGKHYDAIVALGIDMDQAVRQVMQLPGDDAKPAKDPEIDQIKTELEALKAERDAAKAAADKAKADAEREQGRQGVHKYVKDQVKDFPLLSRSEAWIDHALSEADKEYDKVVAELKRELNEDEKSDIIQRNLKAGEEMRQKERQLYLDSQTQSAPARPSPSVVSDFRGGTQGRPVTVGKLTLEQAKARRHATQ